MVGQFQWKIALMDPSGLPTSREQEQWFYRRSGMMMRSPFMLNTDWYDPSLPEWLAPNCVAEAAKDFGFTDDRVRLALARRRAARRKESERLGSRRRDRSEALATMTGKIARAREIARDRKARSRIDGRISCAPDHATPGVRDRHGNRRSRGVFRGCKT